MQAFADQIVKWKHGTSKVDIIKSIKVGIVEAGMPAFAETFSDREIIDLANYIKNGIDEWEAEQPTEKEGEIFETYAGRFRAELVSDAADVPWGMAFLPKGEMLSVFPAYFADRRRMIRREGFMRRTNEAITSPTDF